MIRGSLWIVSLLAIVLSLLPRQGLLAAGDERFDLQSVTFEGKILGVFSAELNGVAGRELVAFEAANGGERWLRVFENNSNRGYSANSTAALRIPPQVFAVQTLDIDGDGLDELLLLGLEAVYIFESVSGVYSTELRELARIERLFSVPGPETISTLEFAFDLNGDSVFELLLPCWRGVLLYVWRDNEFVREHQFEVKQHAGVARNHDFLSHQSAGPFSFRFPRVEVHDLNTDRIKDVFVVTDAGLSVFYQTGSLQFADEPGKELPVRSAYLEDLYFSTSAFGDINGDGLIDYCRVFTQGEGYDAKSLVEVFLGNILDGYPTRPSKRIVLEEFVVGLALVDLDNDGSASLVVATQQFSTVSLVKSLMVRRIPVELKIFGTTGGIIDEEPRAVKKTSCAIDLLRQGFPARFVGCLTADIDSDRKNELVIIDHDDELQVYQGDLEAIFSDKPIHSMSAPNISSLDAIDLNLDRKSDLLLCGTDEDAKPIVMILWAK